jgi:hypothetical protein
MPFNWSEIFETATWVGVLSVAVAIGTWIVLSVLVSAVEHWLKRRPPPKEANH